MTFFNKFSGANYALRSIFLGLAVVLISLWIILGEQITGVSSDAVVNARLSTMRAPIDGTLDMPFRPFGAIVHVGDELATLKDARADRVQLNDLRTERAFSAAEIQRRITLDAGQTKTDANRIPSDPQVLANRSTQKNPQVSSGEHDAALTEMRSQLAAIDVRIAAGTARSALLGNASMTAPTDGLLWEVLADNGEIVSRGQDVLQIMVCNTALVTLSVPVNVYNRLRVGQTGKFRLDGTETLYDGTITRMAGAGATTIYRNLAIAPSIKHLERYDIALLVPGLRTNTELHCTVGQTGRVFFDTRPLDWVRSILN